MNKKLFALLTAIFTVAATGPLFAQEDLVNQVQTGCASEIKNYCSQVTLGGGRLLACFFAHEDKLSSRCQYTLYEASAQLERAVSALNYLANQCKNDIEAHCANVELGEERILDCLESKSELVSAQCTQAIGDIVERD